MKIINNEIWKDIVVDKEEKDKYKGLYQVSNTGKIRSLYGSNKILKPGIDRNGYKQVALSLNGITKQYRVHRLVLLAFDYINYFKGAEVNHKDENPSNNNLDNIEWCTATYNCNYGNHCRKLSESNRGKKRTPEQCKAISISKKAKYIGKLNPAYSTHTNGKRVICMNNLSVYDSAREAGIELKLDNSTISKICKGKKKTIHGYKFMYYSDYLKQVNTEITMEIKKSVVL
jgi:hypothetical protein